MNKPTKQNWEKTYGEIRDQFLGSPHFSGISEAERLSIHRKWTSLGKRVVKGAR